jgi:hypothetical protein
MELELRMMKLRMASDALKHDDGVRMVNTTNMLCRRLQFPGQGLTKGADVFLYCMCNMDADGRVGRSAVSIQHRLPLTIYSNA